MPSVWRALVLTIVSSIAVADSRVVIIETDALALPSLGTRIALHGAGTVDVRTLRDADPATLTARAPRILAEQDATLVVWVQAATERVYVVYVAGKWPDRALIELVRVDAATPASEVERL